MTFLSEGWDRKRFQPFVLVQSAAHVAGVARMYREDDVEDPTELNTWKASREAAGLSPKIFPVAVHPRFGGWFAFRGVLVIGSVSAADLPRPSLCDPLPTSAGRTRALVKFNEGWIDRELGMDVDDVYADEAVEYFGYKTPRERKHAMLAAIKQSGGHTATPEEVVAAGDDGTEAASGASSGAGAGAGAGAGSSNHDGTDGTAGGDGASGDA